MFRTEYIEHPEISFQALVGFRASLAEVGPSPHAERKTSMRQGKFSHLSRALRAVVSEGFLSRKRDKRI